MNTEPTQKKSAQPFDDGDLLLLSTLVANQIRRYERMSWQKDKGLQDVYKHLQGLEAKLKACRGL
ncbi:hypothetical protein [Ectobacillus ponti]|uniref:Uncharacterized protein n=1 Tax=Ectobacillus ponti TaxID=2961894 RepID=A0AA42BNK2_9BACI|nr:hypothetical protein [Ectobacillus ponti]MCP8967752.1 hypothetical protein [Ectobacillus ponti]